MRIHQASASDQVITVCLKTWDVYQSLHPLPNANNAHAEDMREREMDRWTMQKTEWGAYPNCIPSLLRPPPCHEAGALHLPLIGRFALPSVRHRGIEPGVDAGCIAARPTFCLFPWDLIWLPITNNPMIASLSIGMRNNSLRRKEFERTRAISERERERAPTPRAYELWISLTTLRARPGPSGLGFSQSTPCRAIRLSQIDIRQCGTHDTRRGRGRRGRRSREANVWHLSPGPLQQREKGRGFGKRCMH